MDDLIWHKFFKLLYRNEVSEKSRLVIWTLPDKKTISVASYENLPIESVISKKHIYFGQCLMRSGISERGTADNAVVLASLWGDFDIAAPDAHKGTAGGKKIYCADVPQAMKLIDKIGLRPSAVIHSGNGLQAHWFLAEPIHLDSDEGRKTATDLLRKWKLTLMGVAKTMGVSIDSVFDLARVLRVPGTLNHKSTPPKPVNVLDLQSLYYSVDDISAVLVDEQLIAEAERLKDKPGAAMAVEVAAVTLIPEAAVSAEKLEAALENDRTFKKLWEMKSGNNWSPSEYDMALAGWAVRAGWSDQDISDLIIHFRRRHGLNVDKALKRRDYIQRTLAAVKRTNFSAAAAQSIAQMTPSGGIPTPITEPDERKKALENLSKAMQVPVVKFIQVGRENSCYYIVLQGERSEISVKIGGVASLLNPAKFREPLIERTGIVTPMFKAPVWSAMVRLMLAIRTLEENPEAMEPNQARTMIGDYLERTSVYSEPNTLLEGIRSRAPVIFDERLCIYADNLRQFLRIRHDLKLTAAEVFQKLRAAGFRARVLSHDGTSRNYWACSPDATAAYMKDAALSTKKESADEHDEVPV